MENDGTPKRKVKPLRERVQKHIEYYRHMLDLITLSPAIVYSSGKTNIDYARERVEIWELYAHLLDT